MWLISRRERKGVVRCQHEGIRPELTGPIRDRYGDARAARDIEKRDLRGGRGATGEDARRFTDFTKEDNKPNAADEGQPIRTSPSAQPATRRKAVSEQHAIFFGFLLAGCGNAVGGDGMRGH